MMYFVEQYAEQKQYKSINQCRWPSILLPRSSIDQSHLSAVLPMIVPLKSILHAVTSLYGLDRSLVDVPSFSQAKGTDRWGIIKLLKLYVFIEL